MQEGNNARQQVVERIRQSTSILVAVGNNPSVDALAASLGLTLMLNKLNKHTTAVFSGVIPQAIQFLEPSKSFENNVDALRDFIISLDKEKADRLRYKVEDDVVRIFITPYKTSITQADLQFSQGDFNVDLIIALGVEQREDLDKAIVAHGRILHDATVITVNADNQRSTLGSIDWQDSQASSLCEMLVGASESFQQPGILDAQISTALLTGIVAATDRFSNPRTSPRVMTMAAQLMAAGANQQLIATNLEKAKEIAAPAPATPAAGPMAKQQASTAPAPMPEEPPKPKKEPGELDITHEKAQKAAAPAAPAPVPAVTPAPPVKTEQQQEKELEAALPAPQVQHNLLPEVKDELTATTEEEKPSGEPQSLGGKSVNEAPVLNEGKKEEDGEGDYISSHGSWKGKRLEPPTLGGTLNATTEEAHDDAQKAEEADRNKKLLTHPEDSTPPTKNKRNRGKKGKGSANGNGGATNVSANQAAPVAAATAAAAPVLPAEPVVAPLPPAPTPVAQPLDAPVMPPQPTAAPVAEPEVAPAPAPAPEPLPEPAAAAPAPAPTVEPLPPMPPAPQLPVAAPAEAAAPPPALEPQAISAPEPPAPAPLPESPQAPLPEPVPAPAPLPEPAAPESNLEELHKEVADSAAEAAAAAQPAQNAAGDLDSAREAVSAALDAQPFNPAGQPAESVGAQPLPAMPAVPVAEPLSPAALQSLPPAPESNAPLPPVGDLPPMPPMPPMPGSGADLPPAPELPGLNAPLPPISEVPAPASEAPQPPATPPTNDPKQFKIPGQP